MLWWYPEWPLGVSIQFFEHFREVETQPIWAQKDIQKIRGFTTCCTLHDHHLQDKFTKMKRAPLKFNIAPDKNMTIRLLSN